ncbi:hypothetical protein AVEN_75974-1, partial [Araneus ventricosus]
MGGGGLVVRSRPWGRKAPGPKPDPTEDHPCMEPIARQIPRRNIIKLREVSSSSSDCGSKLR